MTSQTIEQRFLQLKMTLSIEEFNSIDFLTEKAEQIKIEDHELSKRILVRVNHLKKKLAKSENSKVVQNEKSINDKNKINTNESTLKRKQPISLQQRFYKLKRSFFIWLVLLPTLLFSCYQVFWASDRYVSRAQVIVQQPDGMATMDSSMAVLTGLGVSNNGVSDTELVKAYILSTDMLKYLDQKLDLKTHFSQDKIDTFNRVDIDDSFEKFYSYYLSRIDVYIDSSSKIVHIEAQAFDAEFVHTLTQTIVERAEWYINSIGHQLANEQLKFILKEHSNIEKNLQEAQTKLLSFQQQYNLLDPTTEGAAMQKITYGLAGEISVKEAELKSLKAIMSDQAPQVIAMSTTLTALKNQLEKERANLSDSEHNVMSVSEILHQFTDLKVKMELALKAYTSSQVSLEKSRIEAYRKLKYLVVVESATKPHDAKYPNVLYNITLFAVLASMIFGIGRIVILTIRELK